MIVQTRVLSQAEAGPLRAALSVASWPAPVLVSIEDTRLGEILVIGLSVVPLLASHFEAFADGANAPSIPISLDRWLVLKSYHPAILYVAQAGCALNLDRGIARLAAGLLRRLLAEAKTRPLGELVVARSLKP